MLKKNVFWLIVFSFLFIVAGSVSAITVPQVDLCSGGGEIGDTVTLPVILTNLPGTSVSAIGMDVGYDIAVLENPTCTIGPAGSDAGKSASCSTPLSGVFRVDVSGSNNTAVGDGVVVYISFTIKVTAPLGNTTLTNTPSASDPDANPVDVTGLNGSITVLGDYTEVTVLQPNGGEIIPSGSNYAILWGAPPEAVKFKLWYSTVNRVTWNPIPKTGDFIGDTNFYNWEVPKPLGNKKKTCFVKVVGYKADGVVVGPDKSNAPFTIEVLKLTSPDGGEIIGSKTWHAITWTTNATKNPVAKVKLCYTKDGGVSWNLISAIPGNNPGSYDWKVPCLKTTSTSCKVKVELKDESGNILGTDASDSYFKIKRTCNDLEGYWNGSETLSLCCEYNGQSECDTIGGSATIFINQNGCNINWFISGTNIERSGTTWCNNLEVGGIFCNPEALPGATFTENYLSMYGTINGDVITLNGSGVCTGTYQGINFACHGTDHAVITRSLYEISEGKQTAKEPKLFMNNSLRIFTAIGQ
jgi:hypothetical protein